MPSFSYHWTPELDARFFAVLAETGSIRAAARAVGMSPKSAYARRRDDPDFAARWRGALCRARDALADRLLEVAMEGLDYHGVRHPLTRRLHFVRSDPRLGRGQGMGKLTRLDRLLTQAAMRCKGETKTTN